MMEKQVLDYGTPAPRVTLPHRPGHAVRTWCLLVSYALVPVMAGHGFGIVGLLLFFGWGGWAVPIALGWAGVALLIFSDLVNHRLPLVVGLLGLCVSVALVMLECRTYWIWMLAGSVPFLAMLVAKVAIDLLRKPE